MAKSASPVRMNLSQFHRYLDEQGRKLRACYKEVEEVQFQFNDIFKQELEAWQEQFAFCYPRLATQRPNLPAAFARHVDRIEEEERERLRREIADLKQRIQKGRAEMDALLAQAQAAGEALRKANPALNEQEEHLKALIVQYQNEYAQAYEEMEALNNGLGGLTNLFKIWRLKKVQRIAKKQQAETMAKLRKVRQAWADKLKETGETQSKLRAKWQETSIEVSQMEARVEHLEKNLDALAEQAALQRVLEELGTPPDVPGELGEGLKELVARNKVRWSYEEGLQAVAETLGLLKGVGEGITRFGRSVQTVLQEQRRYNLKQVDVLVPPLAVRINQIWDELGAKVRDEKYMGKHPLEFSRLVQGYIKRRLTDENIQRYFEEMGEALSRATAAWN